MSVDPFLRLSHLDIAGTDPDTFDDDPDLDGTGRDPNTSCTANTSCTDHGTTGTTDLDGTGTTEDPSEDNASDGTEECGEAISPEDQFGQSAVSGVASHADL